MKTTEKKIRKPFQRYASSAEQTKRLDEDTKKIANILKGYDLHSFNALFEQLKWKFTIQGD